VESVRFDELEEKIKDIIEKSTLLKKRNQELEGLLKNKDSELEEVKNEIRTLNEERGSVRVKVDSLLDMLRDIPA
jgi:uncharacterized coiled-coil DUF342 family protein